MDVNTKILGRRIIAALIDIFCVLLLFLFLFSVVVSPLYNKFSNITKITQRHDTVYEEYSELCVEYGIWIKQLDGTYIENPNVTSATWTAFDNDERVIEAFTELKELDGQLQGNLLQQVIIPMVVSFMLVYLLIPFILKNGQTLGKKLTNLSLSNKFGYKVAPVQVIFRFIVFLTILGGLVSFAVMLLLNPAQENLMYLAIFSAVTLISLVLLILGKNNMSLHDYFAATLVVDNKVSLVFDDASEKQKFVDSIAKK